MPRNNSGTYTLPSAAFVTLTVISSAAANNNNSDIGAALTQSMDTTGISTMSAGVVAAAGTVSLPGITFDSATGTGYYLSNSNEISYTYNGTQTHKINSSGLTMTNADLYDAVGNKCYALPIGMIVPYAGSSAPTLWLLCSGVSVSSTTYSALSTLLGSTFGMAGAGNFLLPDLRGTGPFGLDNMGGTTAGRITNALSGIVGTTIGASGGAQNTTFTQSMLPNVTWTYNQVNHTHSYNTPAVNTVVASASSNAANGTSGQTTGSSTTGITLSSGGSGTALASMGPTMILNYIIFAGA